MHALKRYPLSTPEHKLDKTHLSFPLSLTFALGMLSYTSLTRLIRPLTEAANLNSPCARRFVLHFRLNLRSLYQSATDVGLNLVDDAGHLRMRRQCLKTFIRTPAIQFRPTS
jgi:hypothetical protein